MDSQQAIGEGALVAGRVDAFVVTEPDRARWLIEGYPVFDPVTESAGDEGRILAEPLDEITVHETATVFERQWQIPMVKGYPGLDSRGKQTVDQSIIEFNALGVSCASGIGNEAGPREGEAVSIHPEFREESDVFWPAMIIIAG